MICVEASRMLVKVATERACRGRFGSTRRSMEISVTPPVFRANVAKWTTPSDYIEE
jgi:hypothetical protein